MKAEAKYLAVLFFVVGPAWFYLERYGYLLTVLIVAFLAFWAWSRRR